MFCSRFLFFWLLFSANDHALAVDLSENDRQLIQTMRESWGKREELFRQVQIVWRIDRSGINQWNGYQREYSLPESAEKIEADQHTTSFNADLIRDTGVRWFPKADQEMLALHLGLSDETNLRKRPASYQRFIASIGNHFSDEIPQSRLPYGYDYFMNAQEQVEHFHYRSLDDHLYVVRESQIEKSAIELSHSFLMYPMLIWARPKFLFERTTDPRIVEHDVLIQDQKCFQLTAMAPTGEEVSFWVTSDVHKHVLRCQIRGEEKNTITFENYLKATDQDLSLTGWTIVFGGRESIYPGRENLFHFLHVDVQEITTRPSHSDGFYVPQMIAGSHTIDTIQDKTYQTMVDGQKRELNSHEIMEISFIKKEKLDGEESHFSDRKYYWIGAILLGMALLVGANRWKATKQTIVKETAMNNSEQEVS